MNHNFYCEVCKKYFTRSYSLKLHTQNFHPELLSSRSEFRITRTKLNQKCPLCNYSSNLRLNIEKHLLTTHNIVELNDCKILNFLSKDEFLQWKSHMECKTSTLFVQICGAQYVNQVKTVYYYCNRSGYFVPKGQGKRAFRVKGSSKINSVCPAKIKMLEKSENDIEVHFTDCHLGHDRKICYSYIRKEERDKIASRISQNIPFEQILNELREVAESNVTLRKLKLITKKDLWNIKNSLMQPFQSYSSMKFDEVSSDVDHENADNGSEDVIVTIEDVKLVHADSEETNNDSNEFEDNSGYLIDEES